MRLTAPLYFPWGMPKYQRYLFSMYYDLGDSVHTARSFFLAIANVHFSDYLKTRLVVGVHTLH